LKTYLIILFALAFSTQLITAQDFNGGAYCGFVASQVDGDNFAGFDKSGALAAVMVNTELNRKWLAQLEIRYIQKGSLKNMNPEKSDYLYFKMKFDYVEVPILFIYNFKKTIRFEAGQAIGYLINTEIDENGVIQNHEDFNKIDFSTVLGINYLFNEKLNFSLRYQHSNLPVSGSLSNTTYYTKGGMYNRLLTFTAGYYFLHKTI